MGVIGPGYIKQVSREDIPEIVSFCMETIGEVFPMMDPAVPPLDLQKLEEIYLQPEHATFLAAYSKEGKVIGTIAARPYDGRIQPLQGVYDLATTTEIARCFVAPEWRRSGLGSKLVAEIIPFCKEAGNETLYLHTHRFLPGAVNFWVKQGFTMAYEDNDPTWLTVHMDRKVLG